MDEALTKIIAVMNEAVGHVYAHRSEEDEEEDKQASSALLVRLNCAVDALARLRAAAWLHE